MDRDHVPHLTDVLMPALIRLLVERRGADPSVPDARPTTGGAMQSETIRETIERWEREPAQARSSPTVTARSEGGATTVQAGPFTWTVDLPAALGGGNAAPSPTAQLLGALAGCAAAFIRYTLAPQLGVEVTSVSAQVRCDTDARGLLGLGGAAPDLADLRIGIEIQSTSAPEAVERVLEAWRQRCPVYLALTRPTPVQITSGQVVPSPAAPQ